MSTPAPSAKPSRVRSWSRAIVARVLTVVAIVLAFVGMVAFYVDRTVLDEDGFRSTASALIQDDEIRDQVAVTAAEALFANVDVEALLEERLPEAQKGLAAPLAGIARQLAGQAAIAAFDRPAMQRLWIEVATATQRQLIELLDDKATFVRTEGGDVVLDLRPLVIEIGNRVAVIGNVAQRLPNSAGRIAILKSDELDAMQTGARVLRAGAQWLWLVSLALAALAVWIARGRRRIELRAIAIGIIVVGLLMLGARRLGGAYLVDALADTDAATPATRNAYDIVTQALADRAWVWVTLGLLLLLGVWLAGSGDLARRARTRLAPVAHNPAVSYGAAGALVLVLFTFVPVFQRGFLGALILIGFLAVGVEVLRRQIQHEHPDVQAIGRAPT